MSGLAKAVIFGLLTGLAGLVLSLVPLGFTLEEDVGLDILFKRRGERLAPSDVVIVSIDKESADRLELPNDPEKWPRSYHAHLIDHLAHAGAAVIVFDMIFAEARGAMDDEAFADAIRRAGNVVLFEYLARETVAVLDKRGPPRGTLHIEKLVAPIPLLAHAAIALAPFPLPKVPVKVNQYWTFKIGAGDTPTLPVVVFQIFALEVYDTFLRLLEKASPSHVTTLPRSKETMLATIGVGQFIRAVRDIFTEEPAIAEDILKTLSTEREKQHLITSLTKMYQSANSQYLNFYGRPGTVTTVPYHSVLPRRDQVPEDPKPLDVRGKVVFVGSSEHLRPEQKDGFYTVFSQANGLDISGVEIAATAFANLLEDLPVRQLDWRGHLTVMLFWGMALGVVCRVLPTAIAALIALGLTALYFMIAQHQFTTAGIWPPLVVPLGFQVPLAFFGAALWKYFETHRERQNIRKAFQYYLPTEVIDQLTKSVANVKASSRLMYGICLYTDAEQYTSFAETMEPQELGSLINAYYAAVFEPVRRHGGIVSDVVGDAMLAIWATAQPEATLRHRACLAALEIASNVQRFTHAARTLSLPTRLGLHAGHVLLGNVGALDHYEYRAVGDIVNTSSRLQGLNKYLGTQILVSEEVLDQLDGFLTRELGTFLLAGKVKPLVVHELLCCRQEATSQQRRLCTLFAEALGAYMRQSWEEAIAQFDGIIRSPGTKEDGPSRFYVELCEQYKANPPRGSWSGVVRMAKK